MTVINGLKKMPPQVGVREVKDDTFYRTGWLLDESITQKFLEIATSCKKTISVDLVEQKVVLTKEIAKEQIDLVRGIVMMGYPAYHGLGEWEPVRIILENQEGNYEQMATQTSEELEESSATLWWAGKELQKGKILADYVGKNEKTKIIAKLQGKGQGPPMREPLID